MKMFMVSMIIPESLPAEFWQLIPAHRTVVNELMDKGIMQTYAVNATRSTVWATMSGPSAEEILTMVEQFPIYEYFEDVTVEELFIFDSVNNALPRLVMN